MDIRRVLIYSQVNENYKTILYIHYYYYMLMMILLTLIEMLLLILMCLLRLQFYCNNNSQCSIPQSTRRMY
jgi:uncharacterized membrane protein